MHLELASDSRVISGRTSKLTSSSTECAQKPSENFDTNIILSLQAEREMAGRISLDVIVFLGLLNKSSNSQVAHR